METVHILEILFLTLTTMQQIAATVVSLAYVLVMFSQLVAGLLFILR